MGQDERTNLAEVYNHDWFYGQHRAKQRSPIIAQTILDTFDFDTMIDVGCATGEFIHELLKVGKDCYGMDGGYINLDKLQFPTERFIVHDLRDPYKTDKKYDLCVCMEVAEHIEEEYEDIFLNTVCSLSDKLIFTAAPPGQHGAYHVNRKPREHWINKISGYGFIYNPDKTQIWREKFPFIRGTNTWWYGRNIMVFEK